MSDYSSAAESLVSGSISSMAVKTTLVGGTSAGGLNLVAQAVAPALPEIKSVIHFHLVQFSNYAVTPADICQVIATLWILSQAYLAIKKLIAEKKKPKPKPKPLEKEPIRTMGGSGGGGPEEEETEKQD
jgi:hypothetical protein